MDFAAPNEIKVWLECAFWLAGFIAAMAFIVKLFRAPAPHPPNASLNLTVTQLAERVEKLEQSYARISDKMEEDKTAILAAGEERSVKLHERINDVLAAVSRVTGIVEHMNLRRHP